MQKKLVLTAGVFLLSYTTFAHATDTILGDRPDAICISIAASAASNPEEIAALADRMQDQGDPRGEVLANQLHLRTMLGQFEPLNDGETPLVPRNLPPGLVSSWIPRVSLGPATEWFPKRIMSTRKFFEENFRRIQERLPHFELAHFTDVSRDLGDVKPSKVIEALQALVKGVKQTSVEEPPEDISTQTIETPGGHWVQVEVGRHDNGTRTLTFSVASDYDLQALAGAAFLVRANGKSKLHFADAQGSIELTKTEVTHFQSIQLVGY